MVDVSCCLVYLLLVYSVSLINSALFFFFMFVYICHFRTFYWILLIVEGGTTTFSCLILFIWSLLNNLIASPYTVLYSALFFGHERLKCIKSICKTLCLMTYCLILNWKIQYWLTAVSTNPLYYKSAPTILSLQFYNIRLIITGAQINIVRILIRIKSIGCIYGNRQYNYP